MALLRVILELDGEPAVLHVDHGLRGESPGRTRSSSAGCANGLACAARSGGSARRGGKPAGAGAARSATGSRRRWQARLGLRTIATGHTADDVAETVLMNLARGAGLRGLAGIPPVRGRVVRPLIERTRHEVLAYLAELGQPYRTDPTNLTGKYARNRVRLEVLPVLEELYPGAARNLARAASLAREDLEALEALAGGTFETKGDEVVVPLGELLELPPALRRHAVRRAYSVGAPRCAAARLDARRGGPGAGRGRRGHTHAGPAWRGRRRRPRRGELAFYERAESPEGEEGIRVGETAVFGGWGISASEVSRYEPGDAARAEVAYLDASKGPYRVRVAREGDIIRPLGLGGSKKVLRAMMDRKVPADLRRRTPVVVGGTGRWPGSLSGRWARGSRWTRRRRRYSGWRWKGSREDASMMPDVEEVLISSEEIEAKVREIGARITEDYGARDRCWSASCAGPSW